MTASWCPYRAENGVVVGTGAQLTPSSDDHTSFRGEPSYPPARNSLAPSCCTAVPERGEKAAAPVPNDQVTPSVVDQISFRDPVASEPAISHSRFWNTTRIAFDRALKPGASGFCVQVAPSEETQMSLSSWVPSYPPISHSCPL